MENPLIDTGQIWSNGDESLDLLITEAGRKIQKLAAVFDNGVVSFSGSAARVLFDLLEADYKKIGECDGFNMEERE